MSSITIDTAMAKRMVDTDVISGAAIIGGPGGWSVVLKVGMQETLLCAQGTNKVRIWRSLDRCVEHLKTELGVTRFDWLDATHHSDLDVEGGNPGADAAPRLCSDHEAAEHDEWFREQVAHAIAEADSPGARWIANEDAEASWVKKRAEMVKKAKASAA